MLDIIVNPTARGGQALAVGHRVAQALREQGHAHRLCQADRPEQATHFARRAVEQGVETVIAVGGDGTVRQVARELVQTDVPLGIVPAGTGNDLARSLGLPREPELALQHLLSARPRPVDVGLCDGKPFFNLCGVGFDVRTLEYAQRFKGHLRGMAPYLLGVLGSAVAYRAQPLTVFVDGELFFQGRALIAAIANGSTIGGGIPVAPSAQVSDGLFEVLVIEHMPFMRKCRCLPGLVRGKVESFAATHRCQGRRVVLEPAGHRAELDGEIQWVERAEFSLVPGGILIF